MTESPPPDSRSTSSKYINDQVATLRRMVMTFADMAYNAGVLAGEAAGMGPVMQRMADIQHFEKTFDEALRLVIEPPTTLDALEHEVNRLEEATR